jgi:hypothetical protein
MRMNVSSFESKVVGGGEMIKSCRLRGVEGSKPEEWRENPVEEEETLLMGVVGSVGGHCWMDC